MVSKKLIIFFLIQIMFGYSQNFINDSINLNEVVVSITKIKDSIKKSPFSISSTDYMDFQKNAQQFYLSEYIERNPGIFISNDNNFAQDARISIRGFGSRANFGIRGIKLIIDGVPETTPDGQSQIDNLNLEIIQNIEIIKGTSSSLYGNSSAGVIKIKSLTEFNKNFSKISYSYGSYNQAKKQAFFGLKKNNSFYTILVGETKSEGYRNFSDFKNSNFNLNFKKNISKESWININFNMVNSPYAYDSGGLTITEANNDRKKARDRNVQYKTKEEVNHFKFNSSYGKNFNEKNSFSSYVFISKRNFNGKTPVKNGGAIKLNRNYWGFGANYNNESKFKTQFGIDIGNQNDSRKRFINNQGIIESLVLNQRENFINTGIYLVNNFQVDKFTISSGIRYDINKIELKDQYLEDGNSSDKIKLNSLNPSIGINYKLSKNSRIFINTSSGFETPTLNEYSSSPIGTGFNEELKSQRNMGFEIGVSLFNSKRNSNIDLVYFETVSNNEVLSYEDENFPNQKFYNNAGKSKREGIEILGFYTINKTIISTSFTLGKYIFKEFRDNVNDYKGNKIPGIPNNILTVSLEHKTKNNLFLNFNFKNTGSMFADNSNSVHINKFNTLNFKMGKEFKFYKSMIYPFLIVNNIFEEEYFDNIRINALAGRYYEPAPKRTIFGGIRISL